MINLEIINVLDSCSRRVCMFKEPTGAPFKLEHVTGDVDEGPGLV